MLKFIKSNKKKIALFLAAASVLVGKTQAMNVSKNSAANQKVVKVVEGNVNLLAITTAVLVPALVLVTGLIIWNVNRDKTEDDKKNNQKPDDKNKNQEDLVQAGKFDKNNEEEYDYIKHVNDNLERSKELAGKFNKAVDTIKKYNFVKKDREKLGDFLEVVNGRKVPKKNMEKFSLGLCDPFIFDLNSGLISVNLDCAMYSLILRETDFSIEKYIDGSNKASLILKLNY